MRDDSPRREDADEDDAEPEPGAMDSLLLARAVEMLPPDCRSALRYAYAKSNATPSVQMIRDGGIDGAQVAKCEERLTQIFSSLQASDATEQVPRWVLARENGPVGGHRP
jgi:hypothetical protein